MKIFMVGSKSAFEKMAPIKQELEDMGHIITVPSGYNDPFKEFEMQKLSKEEYLEFKESMLKEQSRRVAANDAVLVINFDKNDQSNYIGGATFLEVFKAWELQKKIFFYNPLPEGVFYDELVGMNPMVINQDLSCIT